MVIFSYVRKKMVILSYVSKKMVIFSYLRKEMVIFRIDKQLVYPTTFICKCPITFPALLYFLQIFYHTIIYEPQN
jgi:hypothetical protein